MVGAEEGQRLAGVDRDPIGLGDKLGRVRLFLELAAKPRIGDIALKKALGVRQGAELLRIMPIEDLAVSLGCHIQASRDPRLRHRSAPIMAAAAASRVHGRYAFTRRQ